MMITYRHITHARIYLAGKDVHVGRAVGYYGDAVVAPAVVRSGSVERVGIAIIATTDVTADTLAHIARRYITPLWIVLTMRRATRVERCIITDDVTTAMSEHVQCSR